MAQPPPRKGAYNKFVVNLHKDQAAKLQAKNQQELDLLDDIRNFMKQKAALEKSYAEGLLKLSSVYGTKKIAALPNITAEGVVGEAGGEAEHNIYIIWRHLLDENEKIAKARLAAVQVFQDQISEDAKNLRSGKNLHAKKSLDRLQGIQKDVQQSVSEVDRTKMVYYTEESDAIDLTSKATVAEDRAKGKKRDVFSILQSKSTLKSKAGKLSVKQEESDIKSTGARNDYLLSLETANAHQDRYFHYELQCTVREMEGGIYEKMSHYLGTLARTELLTCSAIQNSYTNVRQQAEHITREYNYRCYLKAYTCLGDHVQYAFEAVEGDTVCTITPSEHDGGYSLNYEARSTAGKLNQAVRTIRAFKKRIKACQTHKSRGLKQEPNAPPSAPNLDDTIEELETAIRVAETDKAKCEARLNKLREGGVSVDEYLDSISVATIDSDAPQQAPQEWGSSEPSKAETPAAENGGAAEHFGEAAAAEEWAGQGWAGEQQGGEWAEAQEQPPHNGEVAGWGQQASVEQPPAEAPIIDPEADIWKAIVLFTFQANNEDEISITENEQVDILVKECDEEGWVKVRNAAGQVGYAPTNYLEVYASERLPEQAAPQQEGWAGQPMQTIPESGEPGGWAAQPGGWWAQPTCVEPNSSEEEEEGETEAETEDELPPGFTLPPPPPPQLSVEGAGGEKPRPVSIQFGSSMESEYCKGLYDYSANGKDELSFKEDDVIHITSRSPNGLDDGWWMGELDGRTGIFPSIVVEECQANGDDWSPDVSMTECSETEDDMPCFGAPPSLPPLPPAPPGVAAPPPQSVAAPPPPIAAPPPPAAAPPAEAPPPPAAAPPPPVAAPPPPVAAPPPPAAAPPPTAAVASPPPAAAAPPRPPAASAPPRPPAAAAPPAVPPPPVCVAPPTPPTPPADESPPTVDPPTSEAPPPVPPPPTAAQEPATELEAPGMQIKITNPTPTRETAEEAEKEEPPTSYHVENASFSMKMSSDKMEQYQSAVPVEVTVTVEPAPARPAPPVHAVPVTSLGPVECVVTAPTPRSGTPEEKEEETKLFPVTSCSETEEEGGVVGATGTGWTDSEQATSGAGWADSGPAGPTSGGWADFAAPPEAKEPESGGWADFGGAKAEEPKEDLEKSKPQPEKPKEEVKPVVTVTAPATGAKKEVPKQILADLADSDSDSEEINTALQRPSGDTIIPESSSDSESEAVPETEPETGDDRKRASSSETESEDGAEPTDTSREPTPAPPPKAADIRLPPENLEPSKLRRLETMKESPA